MNSSLFMDCSGEGNFSLFQSEEPERSVTPVVADLTDVGTTDVVCGRDKVAHTHSGNKYFRHIIQSYRDRYQRAKRREEKSRITAEIISIVESRGGRFLKLGEGNGNWVEVDAASVHEKVSHALRSAKDPGLMKAKRIRAAAMMLPTSEENAEYKVLLAKQRSYFEELVRRSETAIGLAAVELSAVLLS